MAGNKEGDVDGNKTVGQATAPKRQLQWQPRMAGDKEGSIMARAARAMATATRMADKQQQQRGQQ